MRRACRAGRGNHLRDPARADPSWFGRFFRSALFPLIIVVLLVYLAGQTLFDSEPDADEIAYSEAKTIVAGRPETVRNVVFHPRSKEVELELTSGRSVEARYPSEQSALEFERTLDAQGIRYESRSSGDSSWWPILAYLLPFVLFGAFWIFLMRRGQEKRSDGRRGDLEGEARGQAEDSGTDPGTYR